MFGINRRPLERNRQVAPAALLVLTDGFANIKKKNNQDKSILAEEYFCGRYSGFKTDLFAGLRGWPEATAGLLLSQEEIKFPIFL